MSKYLVFFLIFGGLIYLLFIRNSKQRTNTSGTMPLNNYQLIPSLFSPAEQLFLTTLEEALEGVSVRIYGKTRVADLIRVRRGLSPKDSTIAFNKIRSKRVNFVLVHPSTFSPLLVIELGNSRKKRDEFLDDLLNQVGIPTLHVPAQKSYSHANLRHDIITILNSYQD